MKKRRVACALSLIMIAIMVLSACTDEESRQNRPQDDFYAAVNADWLATSQIPANTTQVSSLGDLGDKVERQLMEDFETMSEDTAAQFDGLPEFLKFYAMTKDYETRNAQGVQPLAPYLKEIDAIDSLATLNTVLPDFILRGLPTPLIATVHADMADAQHYALHFASPSLFLSDVSLYGTPDGEQMLHVFEKSLEELLLQCGYGNEDAARIAKQATAFDALLKPYMLSAEERNDLTKIYNPMTVADFAKTSSSVNLSELLKKLVSSVPEHIVSTNPTYFAALDQVITTENLPLIKSWMTAIMVNTSASMLSEDMETTAAQYDMLLTGITEMEKPETRAYRLASSGVFDEPVGFYYGRTYFGEEAKQDVTAMVEQIKAAYKSRIQTRDWLSSETVQAAVNKLDHMTLRIGYPEKLDPEYSLIKVTPAKEGGTVLSNSMAFTRIVNEKTMAKCGQEIDRTDWTTSASTINAFYHPQTNSINFPAAFLQEPCYSPDQSDSTNLGGIGAVIAHEITHAFDTNGSMFDEYGNFNNWWTEADYAAFGERAQAMVDLFDGIPSGDGKVNGTLTVSENIADAGALACALDVCQSLPDGDLKAFFESWATVWRQKITPEHAKILLITDTHSPNKLRVNMQVSNLEAFYTTFSVNEEDGMYLAPEKRVSIW